MRGKYIKIGLICGAIFVVCVAFFIGNKFILGEEKVTGGMPIDTGDHISESQFVRFLNDRCGRGEDILPACDYADILLTREKMYCIIKDFIFADEDIKRGLIPVKETQEGGYDTLFMERLFKGAEYKDENSYQAQLLAMKKKDASKMQVVSKIYGDSHIKYLFRWGDPPAWGEVFADHEEFSDECTDAFSLACDTGYALYDHDPTDYKLKAEPLALVTLEDAQILAGKILDPSLCVPVCCVILDFREGSELDYGTESENVLLQIPSPDKFCLLSRVQNYYMAQNKKVNSFLAFDTSNISLSLWLSGELSGVFFCPLEGKYLNYQIPSFDKKAIENKINIMLNFVPGDFKEAVASWCKDRMENQNADVLDMGCFSVSSYKYDDNITTFVFNLGGE